MYPYMQTTAHAYHSRMNKISDVVSCLDGYDPKALRVDKAREAIRACLAPVAGVERVATRSALGRVLEQEIVPAFDVPAHDNSAMDGYAVRAADLRAEGEIAAEGDRRRARRAPVQGRARRGRVRAGDDRRGACRPAPTRW